MSFNAYKMLRKRSFSRYFPEEVSTFIYSNFIYSVRKYFGIFEKINNKVKDVSQLFKLIFEMCGNRMYYKRLIAAIRTSWMREIKK